MKNRFTINLESLPEEGEEVSLDLDPGFFGLPETEGKPAGPVEIDGRVQRFENELLYTGYIAAPFQFTCTGCLREFVQTIELETTAVAHEIETGGDVDITDDVREELLINFPAHPRCTEADEELQCLIDPRYLAVDKQAGGDVETPPTPPVDDRWSALDGLTGDSGGSSD